MTTYTFSPNASSTAYDWDNPSTWAGSVVPNGPDADVVLPAITSTSTGQPYVSTVTIKPGESFTIRSLTVADNEVKATNGALSIDGTLTLLSGGVVSGGSLSFASLNNQGTITSVAGSSSTDPITNAGTISGSELDVANFTNTGLLAGDVIQGGTFTNQGTLTGNTGVVFPDGGFTNFASGTLTGGTYQGTALKVGSLVTTLAATVVGDLESIDPVTGATESIQSTLRTIAPNGVLQVAGYATDTLSVAGLFQSGNLAQEEFDTLTANHLSITGDGAVEVNGTVSGPIDNDGVLTGNIPAAGVSDYLGANNPSLTIDNDVTGSGSIRVNRALLDNLSGGLHQRPSSVYRPSSVELKGADTNAVVFEDDTGTLILDHPDEFTGAIIPSFGGSGSGQTVVLDGVALAAIQSVTYSGDGNSGTLTINEGATSLSLRFIGSFDRSSFTLTAGPQPLSNSPPSVILTIGAGPTPPGNAFYIDGSNGIQSITGTANPSFVNTAYAAGSGTVLADLRDGYVQRGTQKDATLGNINGVQLGNQTSVVLGLASGTDLLYGGGGPDSFYNEGGTDYIRGGTGFNQVVGGSGTQIFYGNGGTDVMLGGTGNTFMQAGTTTGSVDRFFGNDGRDFVYGGAGSTTLVGAGGTEDLTGGSGSNILVGSTSAPGFDILNGTTGTDAFYGGAGTNLFYEGSGVDAFRSDGGTDYIYGGSGTSYVYGGSGTDVITTGSGNQQVTAGSGHTYFNDTAAHLQAGRFDTIGNFAGGQSTDLYLPGTVQGATSFVAENGGTAVLTSVAGGTAEIFASGTDASTVQAHTHFTL